MPDGAGILTMVFKSPWVKNFKNQSLWNVDNRYTKIKQLIKILKHHILIIESIAKWFNGGFENSLNWTFEGLDTVGLHINKKYINVKVHI